MKKAFLICLCLIVNSTLFAQDGINVINDESVELSLITFVTTDGSYVPIRKAAGRLEFEETTTKIIVEQFVHLLDAPGKIELERGRYEFTLYEGSFDFVINATGEPQTWEIKPQDDSTIAGILFWGGLGLVAVSNLIPLPEPSFDDVLNGNIYPPVTLIVMGVGAASAIAGIVRHYAFDAPTAKRIR